MSRTWNRRGSRNLSLRSFSDLPSHWTTSPPAQVWPLQMIDFFSSSKDQKAREKAHYACLAARKNGPRLAERSASMCMYDQ